MRPTTATSRTAAVLRALVAVVAMAAVACSNDSSDGSDDSSAVDPSGDGASVVELADGDTVSYVRRAPEGSASDRPTVLFLHGAAYDSGTWEDLGLLADVAALGNRAVAIDLPGTGESTGEADSEWLEASMDALGIDSAVIVAPSASGPVALGLLAEEPQRFAGFVPVAVAGSSEFTWPGGDAPPTVVVRGEDDQGFNGSTGAASALTREIPGAELVVIPGAGHAAYADDPGAFLDAISPLLEPG